MDLQTESTDPPPCETQSSGKIRKGFKLFGKRKPGNIFSIRNKGDENNKSPVKTGKTLDGLSETAGPDSEQDSDKEKGHEVSQGEREQAEEEPLSEDGVLAAAPPRTSISSVSSVRSLSFLSLLRGGRRGMGDHRAHTVSQPVGRQRRGLKGLFGNVKFRSKDKEDKEEAPPSPLLMSSRANSVEIIKEDLTLTPKSQPRSLGSPVTEPIRSVTATSPSDTETPEETSGNVSSTNEHVPPLPDCEPPLVPGDNSLSSLLADISSLLTFESISGGDIMADVEAEWGKASSAISAVVTDVTPSSTSLFSKPSISSPLTSTSVSTVDKAKPSPVASTQSPTPLSKTSTTSSPIAKPSTIITTLTKSSTLTTHSVKLSSDYAPVSTSTTPVVLTSFSASKMSSPLLTTKSTLSTTSTATIAPPNTPATVVKPPSVSPTLTSTISKLASETAAPPQFPTSVSKLSPAATPAPVKPPVTHSPPAPVSNTQHPPIKSDSSGVSALQTSTSFKPFTTSVTAESKSPAAESLASTLAAKPSSPAPVFPPKMTTVHTPTTTSSSVSPALSKPQLTSSSIDITRTTTPLATVPDLTSTFSTFKTQPTLASAAPPSYSLDKFPPAYKPPPAPVSLDKAAPAPTTTPVPASHPGVAVPSQTPSALGQTLLSQSKGPSALATVPGSKDVPAAAEMQISQSKDTPLTARIPVSVSKDLPAPVSAQVTQSKLPPAQAQIPVSIPKDTPAPVSAQIPVSVIRDPPASFSVSVSKETTAPVQVSVSKDTPAPIQISVSKDTPAPAPAQIQLSHSKAPSTPTPAPCPVSSSSFSSPPPSQQSEASVSAQTRGREQASVDEKLSSPSSTDVLSCQMVADKTAELPNESRASLQREKKTPQAKASGLSKIPVVGGGRAGRLPVRDSQHPDDETSRDPPTPVQEEERPNFNSHDAEIKDKIRDGEVNVPTSKHSQEESQQQKVITSLPRDSKIPVKHGASQIPQAKEPPRTKIPVSKVPVRRVGTKPAAVGGGTQIKK
ncbi:APC membrane recruitment protein 2 [Xyrichtys novacula]|uniref:APC membrane recruitment protein 2 n=1 Tax=Xyrichtys novacula TaxID=13765 RepID=A0AAV1FSS2_XYRNO|nr:APC membrane recruitment protein 2 [Xyrichtys novacula]